MVDHPQLQDGMGSHWEPEVVAEQIDKYLRHKQGEQEINLIVTFDKGGISGHPNHIQTHLGVAKVFEQALFPVDVMTLTTVNFVRKYLGYADIHFNTGDEMNYISLTPYHSYRSMMQHHS